MYLTIGVYKFYIKFHAYDLIIDGAGLFADLIRKDLKISLSAGWRAWRSS